MDFSNNLSINGNKIIINVTESDVWSITIIDGNFMLDKYYGRGFSVINIIEFTNLGDGLFGNINFKINNFSCYNGNILNISNNNGSYFTVTPKNILFNKKNDNIDITVNSSCDWKIESYPNDLITITKTSYSSKERSFTIISNSEGEFENQEIIVSNCSGLSETIYVSQKTSYSSLNMLVVNPQMINLKGNDTTFTINVISICDGSNSFGYTNLNGTELTLNKNEIKGTITTDKISDGKIVISNDCESKTVKINYTKDTDEDSYIWITSVGNSEETYEFTEVTATTSYTIISSSNWSIISYDNTKVKCTKSGDKIKLSLGDDRSATSNKEIILQNREGKEARIIYSIADGLVSESGITFAFLENNSEESSIRRKLEENEYNFNASILAYDEKNNPINWKVKSSSFSATTTDLVGGTSGISKTVEFIATESTKNSKLTKYSVILQEQETYKEIIISVELKRAENTVSDGYYIDIEPKSGTYGGSIKNGFQVTVTPTYVYDGVTYYIGSWASMSGSTNYRGVNAYTKLNGSEITPTTVGFDNLIYEIPVNENSTTFEICSTATTHNGELIESAKTCTNIILSAITESSICEFRTDKTNIEVEYDTSSVTYTFISQLDGNMVELDYDQSKVPSWLTIQQDEDGQSVIYSFTKNEESSSRSTSITFNSHCEDINDIIVTITQKANEEITSCMKMSYVTTNLSKPITISYQLANGTQEGTHTVSSNSTQDMCFGNIETTILKAVCNDSDITLSGNVEFEYTYPSTEIKTLYVEQKENEPCNDCVTATIDSDVKGTWEGADGDVYTQIHTLCDDDNNIDITLSINFTMGDISEDSTFDVFFEIKGVGAVITTIETNHDSGTHDGNQAFGFLISNISLGAAVGEEYYQVYGTYSYLNGCDDQIENATYSITVNFNEYS